MEPSAVIAMNEEYKRITGEEVYLYASNPKGPTLHVFCNAQIRDPEAAEEHMSLMLQDAKDGFSHGDIVYRYGLRAAREREKAKWGR